MEATTPHPGPRRPGNPRVWIPVEIGIVVVGILVAFGLNSSRFQEYLALRHLTSRDVAGFYRDLGTQAAAVLERIDELVR